jgi:hypothetical protein
VEQRGEVAVFGVAADVAKLGVILWIWLWIWQKIEVICRRIAREPNSRQTNRAEQLKNTANGKEKAIE